MLLLGVGVLVQRYRDEMLTWQGCRWARGWKSSTSASPMVSTKPSTMPRWSEHTSSGWASASSRNGQWAKATTAVSPSSVPSTAGSKPSRSSSVDQGLQAGGRARCRRRRRPGPAHGRRRRRRRRRRPGRLGQAHQHAGQHRERRRLEAERGRRRRSARTGSAGGRRPCGPRPRPRAARPPASAPGGGGRCSGAGRATRRCRRWRAAWATAPAPGRWRSGCCRRGPSAGPGGESRRRRPQDEITRRRPVKCGCARHDGATDGRGVERAAPRRDRSRARRQHRRPRDGDRRRRSRPTATSPSASSSRSPAARCGRRSRRTSRPASPPTPACGRVTIEWGEMTAEERSPR